MRLTQLIEHCVIYTDDWGSSPNYLNYYPKCEIKFLNHKKNNNNFVAKVF
jgi:hypothetical protein